MSGPGRPRRIDASLVRRALGLFVASLSLVGGSVAFLPARSQEPVQRPNILIVLSDDQRADDTMQVMPKTLKLLGDRGTTFDQFYVTTPLCCPSRSTLLTGRYAHNHFVQNNLMAHNLRQDSTIEHYLQQSGYFTAIAGKFLNGWPVKYQRPPYFDRWATTHGGYYGKRFNINGTVRRVHRYSVDFVADQAVKDLQRFEAVDDDRPWFLYLAPAPPHSPYIAEPRYVHSSGGPWQPSPAVEESDRTDKPLYVQESSASTGHASTVRTKQLRTLRSLDDLVGKVVHATADLDERDTIMIFLSDNGYVWGEHGLNAKRVPYTPAIQVPFMMRWDGHVAAGATDHRLAAMVDVTPTLMEATGLTPSSELPVDGRSLFGSPDRERLLIEHWTQPGKSVPDFASTRTGSIQYVEYYDAHGIITYREYYDLVNDPWQLDNLLGDADPSNDPNPDDVQRLSDQLEDDRQCSGSRCP